MKTSNSFEITSKRIFEVNGEDTLKFQGTSKGNQAKWNIGSNWIKRDYLGYESLSEVIVSKFLECVKDASFVKYDFCSIKYDNVIYKDACYSKNFLEPNESLITVGRLLNIDNAFIKRLLKMEVNDRVKFITNSIESKTGFDPINYIGQQMFLDSIIKNEDRHFFNLALIEDCNGKFSGCPIFDNGGSLLSDVRSYDLDTPLYTNLKNVKSKPFNTNFKKQSELFRNLSVLPLIVDLDKLEIKLSEIEYSNKFELTRALHVLRLGLKEMEGLTWERI